MNSKGMRHSFDIQMKFAGSNLVSAGGKMKSLKLISAIPIIVSLSAFASNAQDSVQLWECKALGEHVGKTEPNYSSDIARWPHGAFKTIERDADYYTSDRSDDPTVEWLEVFATPGGHGNTLIGFLKKENFECIPYQD